MKRRWAIPSRLVRCVTEQADATTGVVVSVGARGRTIGCATKEGMEARIRERFAERTYHRPAGPTGWPLCPFGFSGRTLSLRDAGHSRALKKAIHLGCNVIDTSPTEDLRPSERVVGNLLQGFSESGELARESVVIMAKGGYYLKGTMTPPDSVDITPTLSHSFHPSFIEYQITQSLNALKLDTIDVYLLHDPEKFLMYHDSNYGNIFYAKLQQAFAHLEKEVDRGRIQYYGISSGGLVESPQTKHFISLQKLLDIAKQVNEDSRFAAVAYPLNFCEPNAVLLKNQFDQTLTVSEYAKQAGLMRFSTRPLSTRVPGRLTRLVSYSSHSDKDLPVLVKEIFDFMVNLERSYPGLADHSLPNVSQIAWAQIIANNKDKITDLFEWENVLHNHMQPAIASAIPKVADNVKHNTWVVQYNTALPRLIDRFTNMMEANMHTVSNKLLECLSAACPELATSRDTLQRVALLAVEASGGSDCVLTGMVLEEYVREALLNAWLYPLEITPNWEKLGPAMREFRLS